VANVFVHLQRLYDDLPLIRKRVAELESPNAEDDRPVKFAIVGYSYHRPADSWGREEFEFVTLRRREVADLDTPWIEFVCLAAGYLLGLYQQGHYSDADLRLFEAQLPGFMWLHSEWFTTA
jgi:hypothetical protein